MLGEARPCRQRARPGLDARDEPRAVEPRDGGALALADDVRDRDNGRVLVVPAVRQEPRSDEAADDEDEQKQQPRPEKRRRRPARRGLRWELLLFDDRRPGRLVDNRLFLVSHAAGLAPLRLRET